MNDFLIGGNKKPGRRFVRDLSAWNLNRRTPPSGPSLISTPHDLADNMQQLGVKIPGFDPFAHSTHYEQLRANFRQVFNIHPSSVQYEWPQQPLQIEVVERGGLQIPDCEFDMLLSCAKWEVDPPFPMEARSAWVVCRNPIISTDETHSTIHAFKIKGIGYREGERVFPPRVEQFFRRMHVLIHMGINDDGSFHPVVDPPKPLGGMKISRAKIEFENTNRLLNRGVAAVRPIAYGKYLGLKWEGEPMGFVILASSLAGHERINVYFDSQRDEFGDVVDINPLLRSYLESNFDKLRPGHLGLPIMSCISELARAIGETLRNFHNDGLCRFAGHTGNFQYDLENKTAIMHDLDSVVQIESLGVGAQGLSIIRDIESSLFGLQHSILYSEAYTMFNQENRVQFNPFAALLSGYFCRDVDEKTLTKTGRIILDRFIETTKSMPKYGTFEFAGWFERFSSGFTAKTMELLMPIFSLSTLGSAYPLPYEIDTFRNKMRDYQEEFIRVGQQASRK